MNFVARDFTKGFIAAALALSSAAAFAQSRELRIAHIYGKTGALEASVTVGRRPKPQARD